GSDFTRVCPGLHSGHAEPAWAWRGCNAITAGTLLPPARDIASRLACRTLVTRQRGQGRAGFPLEHLREQASGGLAAEFPDGSGIEKDRHDGCLDFGCLLENIK